MVALYRDDRTVQPRRSTRSIAQQTAVSNVSVLKLRPQAVASLFGRCESARRCDWPSSRNSQVHLKRLALDFRLVRRPRFFGAQIRADLRLPPNAHNPRPPINIPSTTDVEASRFETDSRPLKSMDMFGMFRVVGGLDVARGQRVRFNALLVDPLDWC